MSEDVVGYSGVTASPQPEDLQETAKKKVLDHFERRIKKAGEFCKSLWDTAEQNQRFQRGGEHQWNPSDYAARRATQRPTFSMPDIQLAVNALSGREVTNRTEATFLSRQGEAAGTAEVLREWKRVQEERCRAPYVHSAAFRDLAIECYSWVERARIFDGKPKGRMVKRHPPLWEMIWDQTAREQNLVDREWDARGYFISIDEFVMEHPEYSGKMEQLLAGGDKPGWIDPTTSSTTNRWPWLYRTAGRYINVAHREIFKVDYEYRQRAPCFHTLVPPGCAPSEVTADELEQMLQAQQQYQQDMQAYQQQMQQFQAMQGQPQMPGVPPPEQPQPPQEPPPIPKPAFPPDGLSEDEWGQYQQDYQAYVAQFPEVVQQLELPEVPAALGPQDGQYRWEFWRAQIVGKEVIKNERLPYRRFSRNCITAFPFSQPGGTTFFGLVDLMRDPQVFKNYIYSMGVSLLQRSAKNAMLVKPGFFEDPADAEKRFASPAAMITISPQANLETDMREVEANLYPSGFDKWIETADQATWRPTGLNPQTLGDLPDARRVSGTVLSTLNNAPSVVLATLFDSFELFLKDDGELFLAFTRAYDDPEDLQAVVGPEKAAFVPPKEKWETVMQRDVIVSQSPASDQEKQEMWDLLSRQGTIDKWVESGKMPMKIALKFFPDQWLSEVDKQEWLQILDQQQQAQAQQNTPQPRPPSQVVNYSLGKSGQPQVDAAIAQEIGSAVGALPHQG